MEKFEQKWAAVALLEDATDGSEFYYTNFPLHITLAGVFKTELTGTQLVNELRELLADQCSFQASGEAEALFGSNQDVKVMKIRQTKELMDLYQKIYEWLEKHKVIYNDPQYQGRSYIPHSTHQKNKKVGKDEAVTINSVSIIDLFPNNNGHQRRVLKTIALY